MFFVLNKECKKKFEIKFDVGTSVIDVDIVDAIKCFFFAEIVHRGKVIKKAMDSRNRFRFPRSKGKKIGTYLGKMAVRVSGNFNSTTTKTVQGINFKYCKTIQKGDGYVYTMATIKQ